jgi:hypothetical protein
MVLQLPVKSSDLIKLSKSRSEDMKKQSLVFGIFGGYTSRNIFRLRADSGIASPVLLFG